MSVEKLTTAMEDRYRIERELGQGGMATVYLAHDVRHDRKVALKVLRPELAAILGGERFLAEIKTTANLQHPHILSLFDSGEAGGLVFYVMPYVDGESLRDRLSREKQLPVDEAVRIAREVADALHYAHQHGIVHRDIKPENILLHGGHAMVADFGIALAASRSEGGTRMTETGMSLGTPQYMSPEQAMGDREITPRADVYALGCVLYEMLTAEPPFVGATAQAIIARVMTEEPRSLTVQRRTIPAHVEAAVHMALQKLPADRFATAAEFAAALANPGFAGSGTRTAFAVPGARAGWRPRAAALLPWAVALAALAVAGWAAQPRATAAAPVVLRYAIKLQDSLNYDETTGGGLAISPDGSVIAYESPLGLLMRSSDRLEIVPVAGGRDGSMPFFSPDGQWLGFRRGPALVKTAVAGGTPVTMCDSCPGFYYHWGADDTIRYHGTPAANQNTRVLMATAATKGPPRVFAAPDSGSGEMFRSPVLLPDRRTVVFNVFDGLTPRVAKLDLRSGTITRFELTGSRPRWVAGGWVVIGAEEGALVAVPFDRELRPAGAAVSIARDMMSGDFTETRAGVALNGTIVYAQSGWTAERRLVAVSRTGQTTDLLGETRAFLQPRVSPDGRFVAFGLGGLGDQDVWVLDIAQRALSRLTTDRISGYPAWTPDGRTLLYASNYDLWRVAADGSTRPESLLVASGSRFPGSVTPDGRSVVFYEEGPLATGLRTLAFDSAPAARTILAATFNESAPALSPDGRWLAYQSDESGRTEVYVRPFPGMGARVPVSVQGGSGPAWSRDGRELFFVKADTLMAATVTARPPFAVQSRRALFRLEGMLPGARGGRGYDVTPDGRRFVMVQGGSAPSSLIAVHHFFERLAYDAARRP